MKKLMKAFRDSLKELLLQNTVQKDFNNVMKAIGSIDATDEFVTIRIPERHVHLLKVCESFSIRNSLDLIDSFKGNFKGRVVYMGNIVNCPNCFSYAYKGQLKCLVCHHDLTNYPEFKTGTST